MFFFFFFNFCFTAIPLQDFYHIRDASRGRQCSMTQLAIHKISGGLLSHPLEQAVKVSVSFLSKAENTLRLNEAQGSVLGSPTSTEVVPLLYKWDQPLQ